MVYCQLSGKEGYKIHIKNNINELQTPKLQELMKLVKHKIPLNCLLRLHRHTAANEHFCYLNKPKLNTHYMDT